MSLIYGVPEMAEEEVLEQIAFQAVQYLRLDDPKYKKADTLSKILVAAKDKPKEDEIVYIEALESIIGENGSYKDLGDAKIVDKSWDTEGTQFNIKGFQHVLSSLMEKSMCAFAVLLMVHGLTMVMEWPVETI